VWTKGPRCAGVPEARLGTIPPASLSWPRDAPIRTMHATTTEHKIRPKSSGAWSRYTNRIRLHILENHRSGLGTRLMRARFNRYGRPATSGVRRRRPQRNRRGNGAAYGPPSIGDPSTVSPSRTGALPRLAERFLRWSDARREVQAWAVAKQKPWRAEASLEASLTIALADPACSVTAQSFSTPPGSSCGAGSRCAQLGSYALPPFRRVASSSLESTCSLVRML
jgi:hypothetical protein